MTMTTLSIGHDTHGNTVRLGGTDADGYSVGWIHPTTGNAYRDEREYWCATAAGSYTDAYNEWRRAGRLGPEPGPALYALVHGGPHVLAATRECEDHRDLLRLAVRMRGR